MYGKELLTSGFLSAKSCTLGTTCLWKGATHSPGLLRAIVELLSTLFTLTLQLSMYLILPGHRTRTQDPLNGGTKRAITQTGLRHTPHHQPAHHIGGDEKRRRREELQSFRDPRPSSTSSQGCDTLLGLCGSWHLQASGCHCVPWCPQWKPLVLYLVQSQPCREPAPLWAPRAACPTAAGMHGCTQWLDLVLARLPTPHCFMCGSPLAGVGTGLVARAKHSLLG